LLRGEKANSRSGVQSREKKAHLRDAGDPIPALEILNDENNMGSRRANGIQAEGSITENGVLKGGTRRTYVGALGTETLLRVKRTSVVLRGGER